MKYFLLTLALFICVAILFIVVAISSNYLVGAAFLVLAAIIASYLFNYME